MPFTSQPGNLTNGLLHSRFDPHLRKIDQMSTEKVELGSRGRMQSYPEQDEDVSLRFLLACCVVYETG